MASRAVMDAIDQVISEAPPQGKGLAFVHPDPEFSEDVGRVQITRFYAGGDVPATHTEEPDGTVKNDYHLYFSTSALALVELARKLNPRDEDLDGIWYLEVGQDRFSRSFNYSETRSGLPSYEMLTDLYYLATVLGEMQGPETTQLASFVGTKRAPASDEFDVVGEIIALLEKIGEFISEKSESLGEILKVRPELWDPKKRSENLREVIDDAAKLLTTVASGFKDGIGEMVKFIFDSVENTASALEELFDTGASAVVDFLSDNLGDLADPAVAAKEFAQLVLEVFRVVRSKIRALRELGNDVVDWFDKTFGSLQESVDVLIGYFSGVWNGLVDAILGIFDTVNLIVTIILGLFRVGAVADDAWDLALEIIDEILVGLEATSWTDIWAEFTENIYPEIRDTLLEQGRALADAIDKAFTSNNAAVGYYLGYVVYMVVENFFPPIKLTKVARAASRSAEATAAFLKRLGKFNKGSFPVAANA